MKPYYEDEFVTLYHGRCEDVVPGLSGVDCVVTPCPYSRKFSNGVLFVCTLEANHKGNHLTWKASKTWAEQGNRTPVRGTIGAENELVRASLRTTPDPASPTEED